MKTLLVLVAVSACLLVSASGVLTDFRGSLKEFLDRGPTNVRVEQAKKDIAVAVNGGDQEAASVADRCGLTNKGQVKIKLKTILTEEKGKLHIIIYFSLPFMLIQVGNLVGYYHFQVESSSELEQVKECLETDQRVSVRTVKQRVY
jgi:hypothetical protein